MNSRVSPNSPDDSSNKLGSQKPGVNLPTSVVITGVDKMEFLDQALEAARTFKQMSPGEVASLLSRTSQAAASGQYELFKTSTRFDATAHNP